jgi:hypothetical protein
LRQLLLWYGAPAVSFARRSDPRPARNSERIQRFQRRTSRADAWSIAYAGRRDRFVAGSPRNAAIFSPRASGRNCATAAAASSTASWRCGRGRGGRTLSGTEITDRHSCETSENENVWILPPADLSSGEEIGREYVCRVRAVRSLRRF